MDRQSQSIVIDSVRLHVQDEGSGEPILLLHGFPDSSALWRYIVPKLHESGYRSIAPDLRGFGLSDAPAHVSAYTLDSLAHDVLGVLDQLGVRSCRVVGHDWGAVLGWWLAAHAPRRVKDLVAVSVGHPAAYARAGVSQKLRAWYALYFQLRGVAEFSLRANHWMMLRTLTRHHPERERWIEDLSRPGRLSAGLNWYRANLWKLARGNFPHARVPVLGVWSTQDGALVEQQMAGSAAYVDASFEYRRLEGVSHWVPLDAPGILSQWILDFQPAQAAVNERSSRSGTANRIE
jgi:pimeloyl-ACP methyl ester carboxylesterase